MKIKARTLYALRHLNYRVSGEEGQTDATGELILGWYPVRPGTFWGRVTDASVWDDGNGNIFAKVGEHTRQLGLIDYMTGKVKLYFCQLLFYSFSYAYDPEAAPKKVYEMRITSTPILARARKLRPNARVVRRAVRELAEDFELIGFDWVRDPLPGHGQNR